MAAAKLFRPWDDSWRQPIALNACQTTERASYKSANYRQLWRSANAKSKRHICCHCNRSFYNKSQLKGHLRIHTGERPFRCDHLGCSKTFTRREELIRHQRTHTGLRPYACNVCNKRFGRKDHLKKHAKIHIKNRVNTTLLSPVPKIKYLEILS